MRSAKLNSCRLLRVVAVLVVVMPVEVDPEVPAGPVVAEPVVIEPDDPAVVDVVDDGVDVVVRTPGDCCCDVDGNGDVAALISC